MSSSSTSSKQSADTIDETETDIKEEEPVVETIQHPLLTLANDLFLLASPDANLDATEKKVRFDSIQQRLNEDRMSGFIAHLNSKRTEASTEVSFKFLSENGWKDDAASVASMNAANEKEFESIEAKIKEATEVAGDTEVREAMLLRANLAAKIGDRTRALEEYNLVFEKTVGVASKIDVLLSKLRVSLAFLDTRNAHGDVNLKQFKTDLDKAKTLVEQGGDWERKNQLSVYESLYLMITRQFKDASKLLLDAIATFTTTELFDYTTFVLHTCVLALIFVDRATLYKEIIKSPEILAVLDDIDGLKTLIQSLYKCNYKEFFSALNTLLPAMQRSRYLAPHLKYYLRELRVVAYTQFLSSYKSARLEAMAESFGVSVEFMDAELFQFISSGRIHAKIDKVDARVDTTRPDKRNEIYGQLVKNGDVLLNRLHKLSKVIAL